MEAVGRKQGQLIPDRSGGSEQDEVGIKKQTGMGQDAVEALSAAHKC